MEKEKPKYLGETIPPIPVPRIYAPRRARIEERPLKTEPLFIPLSLSLLQVQNLILYDSVKNKILVW